MHNSFRFVTTGSLIGLSAIALLATSKATIDQASWWNLQQEKNQAENTKAIADAYRKNQVTTFNNLMIRDYTLNNQPPRINWRYTVDPSKKTIIYDQYRRCVGYALHGKFYFVLYYKGACN